MGTGVENGGNVMFMTLARGELVWLLGCNEVEGVRRREDVKRGESFRFVSSSVWVSLQARQPSRPSGKEVPSLLSHITSHADGAAAAIGSPLLSTS